MRIFLSIFVLIFILQSWTKADDIKDFEIHGISIGDSLLDYYSADEIYENIDPNVFKNKDLKVSKIISQILQCDYLILCLPLVHKYFFIMFKQKISSIDLLT